MYDKALWDLWPGVFPCVCVCSVCLCLCLSMSLCLCCYCCWAVASSDVLLVGELALVVDLPVKGLQRSPQSMVGPELCQSQVQLPLAAIPVHVHQGCRLVAPATTNGARLGVVLVLPATPSLAIRPVPPHTRVVLILFPKRAVLVHVALVLHPEVR